MMKSDRATRMVRPASLLSPKRLTPVLKCHGFREGSGVSLQTRDRLVVEPSDGLREDVTSARDTALVSGDKSGQQRLGEPGEDLEFTGNGSLLKSGSVLGEVCLGLGVNSESMTLSDFCASQLFMSGWGHCRQRGHQTLAPKQLGCSASSISSSEERSIPEAAPLISSDEDRLDRESYCDSREIVDHDRNGGSVQDSFEETKDSLSVVTHSESKIA